MMRLIALLCVLGVVSGCAGADARRVRCERHLTPINRRGDGALASAGSVGTRGAAPAIDPTTASPRVPATAAGR
ncbi:MAG: hypothetical protein ACREUG_13655, partial [Steroidobacteraceae bacterium]